MRRKRNTKTTMQIEKIRTVLHEIAPVECDGNADIHYLLTDSRQLGSHPEQTLFFALHTEKDDGANYINELKQKGVRAFVRENALAALQALAAYKRQQFTGQVIGITGSHGKTVVKEWLYDLLREDYRIIRSPRSYNSQIGVPLSVWQLGEENLLDDTQDKPELAIFEAGISRPGEMERLEPIIRPTIGVITYIGEERDAEFGSLEEKREEKMRLFAHCPVVIEEPTHQNVRTCAAVMRQLGYDEQTISERILRQTHETVMQVDMNALIDNVAAYKSLLAPNTKMTAMVKAFAYGTGSVEVSRALQRSGMVDYLAVAVADEGEELRRAGITLPILTMNPEESAINQIFANNLEPNIYSFPCLQMVMDAASRQGLEHYPVHIKIDSGMHRLGFYQEDLPRLIELLRNQKVVRVQSVFSHLAAADEPQWDRFTRQQITYFQHAASTLELGIGYPVIKHILNSAGIERFTDCQMDMVRLGIGLYGLSVADTLGTTTGQLHLKNVCTLKTTILSIKTVREGETIGYGRRTQLTSDRRIAVIPIGYADGFDRRLSNYNGFVMVRGRRCPVVGNVCMDQTMIDVTDTDAHEGDYATVFGEDVPLQDFAARLGTIPYEILTSVSRRVQRQYIYR